MEVSGGKHGDPGHKLLTVIGAVLCVILLPILLINLTLIAYAGPVVQAFRRPWCIDSGFMVHAFR